MIKPEELRKARKAAGLTQEQAASLVYITERTWRKWEMGEVFGKLDKNSYKARTELFMYKIGDNNE